MRFAFRQLARNPGFSAIAVLVLALGIGANSAMFSLVNALLFRPLTAAHPEELVGVYSRKLNPVGDYRAFSYPNFADLRERADVFTELAAYNVSMTGLREGDVTRRTFTGVVSANYLRTFGVRPILGRDFLPEEERPDSAASVAIVSHHWWQRSGAEPAILGRSLTINGHPFTIIGVAPEGFTGTTALFSPDLWVPLGANQLVVNDFTERRGRSLHDRGNHQLMLVGRLKAGLTPATATTRLEPLARQFADAHPAENKDHSLELNPLPRLSITTHPQNNSELRGLAFLLLPMSGVVLLVACLNLANMLLARSAARRKEMAIRLALGGGRRRILSQLLGEGLLLSLLGSGVGLIFAWAVPILLAHSLTGRLPGITLVLEAGPDLRVFSYTLAFSVIATLLFAFVPAWKLTRTDVVHDLKDQGADETGGRVRTGVFAPRNLLVAGQLALSLGLLTSACLFLRGARNAAAASPGFAFDDGLLVELDAGLAGLDETQGRPLYLRALERIRALPGVASASYASIVPFGMFYDARSVRPVGGFPPGALRNDALGGSAGGGGGGIRVSSTASSDSSKPGEERVSAGFVITGHDYFQTVGLPLLKGRDFDRLEEQGASAAPVAIVDESLARRLWGDLDPIGRQFETIERGQDGKPRTFEVIGVVAGVRQELTEKQNNARLYVPLGQHYQSWINLHVRLSQPSPAAAAVLLRTVREELRKEDQRLPVLSMNTLRSFHDQGVIMWGFRTAVKLFGAFAFLALFLSVVGVYGVRAYLVARRTREIGIRVALGASRHEVLRLVLGEGYKLAAVGLGTGALLSLLVGRLLASTLYEVGWADPVSLGASLAILGAATLVACWIPARRASRIDPMRALRCE